MGILNNYNLCHIKTIQWSEIITGPNSMYVYVYNFTEPERDCTPCHETCEVELYSIFAFNSGSKREQNVLELMVLSSFSSFWSTQLFVHVK